MQLRYRNEIYTTQQILIYSAVPIVVYILVYTVNTLLSNAKVYSSVQYKYQ